MSSLPKINMSLFRTIPPLHRHKLGHLFPTRVLSTSQLKASLAPFYMTLHQQHYYSTDLYCRHHPFHKYKRFYFYLSANYLQVKNFFISSSSSAPSSSQRLPFSSETLLVSETGKTRLKQILKSKDGTYLRVIVEGGGCSGFQYKFNIETKKIEEDDIALSETGSEDDAMVVIDKTSLDILKGSTIDYETELIRSAFRIVNIPLAEQGCSCGASFNVKID